MEQRWNNDPADSSEANQLADLHAHLVRTLLALVAELLCEVTRLEGQERPGAPDASVLQMTPITLRSSATNCCGVGAKTGGFPERRMTTLRRPGKVSPNGYATQSRRLSDARSFCAALSTASAKLC